MNRRSSEKSDDVIEFFVNLFFGEAQHRRVEIYVIPPRKFRIEADAKFKKWRNTAIDGHFPTLVRLINPRQYFQQC